MSNTVQNLKQSKRKFTENVLNSYFNRLSGEEKNQLLDAMNIKSRATKARYFSDPGNRLSINQGKIACDFFEQIFHLVFDIEDLATPIEEFQPTVEARMDQLKFKTV